MPARPAPLPPPKPAASYHFLAESLRSLEGALRHGLQGGHFIPEDWREIARREPVPDKEKLTLRVDADVVKFFRLMGRGYLGQMNRVLRAFMQARLAGVVKGPEEVRYVPEGLEAFAMASADLVEFATESLSLAQKGHDVSARDVVQAKMEARLKMLELALPRELREG